MRIDDIKRLEKTIVFLDTLDAQKERIEAEFRFINGVDYYKKKLKETVAFLDGLDVKGCKHAAQHLKSVLEAIELRGK